VSVRRNRPDHPSAWYVLGCGMAFWAVGMGPYSWYKHASAILRFPTFADVAFMTAHPLIAGGLLMFARSRGRELRPIALLDSAIVTLGVGLLSWVFLIQPIWVAEGHPMLTRFVALAYPLGNRRSTKGVRRQRRRRGRRVCVASLLHARLLCHARGHLPSGVCGGEPQPVRCAQPDRVCRILA
jgi:hypothetical protein